MFGSLPQPAFMPCPSCGASIPRSAEDEHVCDETQRLAFEVHQVQLEAERFDGELASWLVTPHGRFAVYYAERERRRAA